MKNGIKQLEKKNAIEEAKKRRDLENQKEFEEKKAIDEAKKQRDLENQILKDGGKVDSELSKF